MDDKRMELTERRSFYVVRGNEILRTARLELTLRESKLLCFLISMIKPNDRYDTIYSLSIPEYCRIAGINFESGTNYEAIKKNIKALRDKSIWILDEEGNYCLNGWITRPKINPKSGKIYFQFDYDVARYLFALKNDYTQIELLCVLPMKSAYSVKLFEWMRSYAYNSNSEKIDLKQLKKLLNVDTKKSYDSFRELRRRVLDPAVKEINEFTDLQCSYERHFDAQRVIAVTFHFEIKDLNERMETYRNVDKALDGDTTISGQMTIYDLMHD